jgi:Protein of unknown function (DUF1653)
MTPVPMRAASSGTLPKPGLYRHFKGGEYEVQQVARHSETEEWLVVYCAVDDPATIWVRPLEMFNGLVEEADGSLPRFELTAPLKQRSDGLLGHLLARVTRLAGRTATPGLTFVLGSRARPSVLVARRERP